MSKTEFSPSPWTWDLPEGWEGDWYEGPLPRLVDSEGSSVLTAGDCTQYYPTAGSPPNEADRNLIASAPDLLEALDACFDLIAADYKDHMAWPHAYHLAEAALAKARGEAT